MTGRGRAAVMLLASLRLGASAAAQVPLPFADVDVAAGLPAGESAWVVQILTRGGLSGRGSGDVLVSSSGELRCVPAACRSTQLPPPRLQDFAEAIRGTMANPWISPPVSSCNDCITTLMIVTTREKGVVQTRTAHWNDIDRARVPPTVSRFYDQAMSLAR